MYPRGYWSPEQERAIAARRRRDAQAHEIDELIGNVAHMTGSECAELAAELRAIVVARAGLRCDPFVMGQDTIFHDACRRYLRGVHGAELKRLLAAADARVATARMAEGVIRSIWSMPVPCGADDVDGDGADTCNP